MKKNLILHIGMGKTGTTALQEFFWLNRAQLKRDGILYPATGTVARAHHLLSPYRPDNLKNKWNWIAVDKWAPQLGGATCDSILLSSELIAWTPEDAVAEFCRSLQEWFNLSVVIYVRRQDSMVMANYNQLVKAGSQRRELENTWKEDAERFDYWRIIAPWAASVGARNVIVRPYEKQQFYRGDIRHDFMNHVFGGECSAKYVMPSTHFNPRLNAFAIAYKFRLYELFLDREQVEQFNRALLSYSSETDDSGSAIFSDQPLLPPEIRKQIIGRLAASNERIATEFLGRSDGELFKEPLPDESEYWTPQTLDAAHAKAISHYIGSLSSKMARRLFEEVQEGRISSDHRRRAAAEFLHPSLPVGIIGGLKERGGRRLFRRKGSDKSDATASASLLLISVHLPAATAETYFDRIRQNFGNYVVLDYADKPMGSSSVSRNAKALRDCLGYVPLIHESTYPVCIHGHFMPLKYGLFQSNLRKRYVTWMRDPVDRLVDHYWQWKSCAEGDRAGKLRLRMLEEDWSLERFAFCPEVKNIYSKFLWGFPLQKFAFVGIAEFGELEVQRFDRDVLGNVQTLELAKESAPGFQTSHPVDPAFRERIEKYHAADVRLYRNALGLRRSKIIESGGLELGGRP